MSGMPWETVTAMDAKRQVLELYLSGAMSMAEACATKGVTAKTGYKWLSRWKALGRAGLEEQSRAPKRSPQRWPQATRDEVIKRKKKRPSWGPKKLVSVLEDEGWEMPAPSTAGAWLEEAGLVRKRWRVATSSKPTPLTQATRPNEVWCYDFKGAFRLGDGRLCYPLTVTDDFSRMLLGCFALPSPSAEASQRCMERLFREYGVPNVLRSDNGQPFASTALAGLTKMNVAWRKQGIRIERIERGNPRQNARHERMHRTLKAETARPPKGSMRSQQRRFDAWRIDFNTERPHEGLGMDKPVEHYGPPLREYSDNPPEATYPGHFEVRRVRNRGHMRIAGSELFISEALIGEKVGLVEVADGLWQLHFLRELICVIDLRGPTAKRIGSSPSLL